MGTGRDRNRKKLGEHVRIESGRMREELRVSIAEPPYEYELRTKDNNR